MIDINKIGVCALSQNEVNDLLLKTLMFRIVVAGPTELVSFNGPMDGQDTHATVRKLDDDVWAFVFYRDDPSYSEMIHRYNVMTTDLEVISPNGLELSYLSRVDALSRVLAGLYALGFPTPKDIINEQNQANR